MSSSCAVCMEALAAQIAALPCGHVFHAECAMSWMQQQRSQPGHQTSCALCKAPCNSSDVMRFSFEPMDRIRRYLERSEAEAAEQRDKQALQKRNGDDMSDVEVIDVEAPLIPQTLVPTPVLLSPLLFQLRLSGIEESITQAKERIDLINPQFHALLQRFTDISENAKTESAAATRLREESDQIKTQTELNKDLFVAKNTKLESLQRAKAVLAKHRISWTIIQECVRREEAHLANAESAARTAESNWDRSRSHLLKHELMQDDEQADDHVRAEAESSSSALHDERMYERNVAYSSHLLHASTAGTFDPERHPLMNSNTAKENGRSTRLHLLKMQAAFLSRRIEDLSQSRSQVSFIQNAKNEEKQMELRAMEARLRAQQEEYRKRKERVESLGYELERIREERNTDPSRLSQPSSSVARKPAQTKPASMDAPAIATVVRSSDLAQNKRKRDEGPREATDDSLRKGVKGVTIPGSSSSTLPHAAYRERPRTTTTVSSLLSPTASQPTFSMSPPAASQQHGLIATHRVLPHNHRQLAEQEQEKEMEEILTELWQD